MITVFGPKGEVIDTPERFCDEETGKYYYENITGMAISGIRFQKPSDSKKFQAISPVAERNLPPLAGPKNLFPSRQEFFSCDDQDLCLETAEKICAFIKRPSLDTKSCMDTSIREIRKRNITLELPEKLMIEKIGQLGNALLQIERKQSIQEEKKF